LGLTGATAEELQHLEGSKKGVEEGSKKRGPEEREEWMINPGEDRAIAGTVQYVICAAMKAPYCRECVRQISD
jgi:hypothetical protein